MNIKREEGRRAEKKGKFGMLKQVSQDNFHISLYGISGPSIVNITLVGSLKCRTMSSRSWPRNPQNFIFPKLVGYAISLNDNLYVYTSETVLPLKSQWRRDVVPKNCAATCAIPSPCLISALV